MTTGERDLLIDLYAVAAMDVDGLLHLLVAAARSALREVTVV
ncbi:hypothetical protein ACFYXV_29110 [Streptomyces sp. NPDC002181]